MWEMEFVSCGKLTYQQSFWIKCQILDTTKWHTHGSKILITSAFWPIAPEQNRWHSDVNRHARDKPKTAERKTKPQEPGINREAWSAVTGENALSREMCRNGAVGIQRQRIFASFFRRWAMGDSGLGLGRSTHSASSSVRLNGRSIRITGLEAYRVVRCRGSQLVYTNVGQPNTSRGPNLIYRAPSGAR
jgi:hypothetical protein